MRIASPARSPLLASILLGVAAGCSGPKGTVDSTPVGDSAGPAPEQCGYTPATDLDPSPNTVEVDLTASSLVWDPGTGVGLDDGVAYDGTVPGPLIELNVGDTLVAHFHNDLDEPSTIHWHGIRLDSSMDGGMQMMDPVQPGDSFDYIFTVPDAGFYWYHPHLDGAKLLEGGMYGAIIVHAADEGQADCDLPMMLDDILLDEDTNQIAPPDTSMMQLMGRLGNHLMVNGKVDRRIGLTAGQTVLMRLVNPSNARFWDVYVEGQQLEVVGTDDGWLPTPYPVSDLELTPGERYMVEFTATGNPGDELRLMNKRFQLHAADADMVETDPLGNGDNPVATFVFGPGTVAGTPWTQPTVEPLPWSGPAATLGHHWQLNENMGAGEVSIDGQAYPNVPLVTCAANTDTTFEIENLSEMHHPFHIHGNRFEVVDVNGVPPTTPQGWKDTFDIPPYDTVTVVSDMSNPGDWMYHCHILEHAEAGMMGEMMVQ